MCRRVCVWTEGCVQDLWKEGSVCAEWFRQQRRDGEGLAVREPLSPQEIWGRQAPCGGRCPQLHLAERSALLRCGPGRFVGILSSGSGPSDGPEEAVSGEPMPPRSAG